MYENLFVHYILRFVYTLVTVSGVDYKVHVCICLYDEKQELFSKHSEVRNRPTNRTIYSLISVDCMFLREQILFTSFLCLSPIHYSLHLNICGSQGEIHAFVSVSYEALCFFALVMVRSALLYAKSVHLLSNDVNRRKD